MNTSYIAVTLGGLNPDNIETTYNKRLQKYYFDHSRKVEYTPDEDNMFFLEYDKQGNIINAEFDKIYKTGVSIPETDFINQQLNQIEKVNTKGLKQEHKALLRHYKDFLNKKLLSKNTNEDADIEKSIPAKYYALYHWVLIEMGKEMAFEKNRDDKHPKEKIKLYAKNKYKKISSQQFYNFYKDIDLTNKALIAKEYGKEYKSKLIEISNNDAQVILHLKKYPN